MMAETSSENSSGSSLENFNGTQLRHSTNPEEKLFIFQVKLENFDRCAHLSEPLKNDHWVRFDNINWRVIFMTQPSRSNRKVLCLDYRLETSSRTNKWLTGGAIATIRVRSRREDKEDVVGRVLQMSDQQCYPHTLARCKTLLKTANGYINADNSLDITVEISKYEMAFDSARLQESEKRAKLSLTIPHFSEWIKSASNWTGEQTLSDAVVVKGVPWRISAQSKPKDSCQSLQFFLLCDAKMLTNAQWSCAASAKLILKTQEAGKPDITKRITHLFTDEQEDWGFRQFQYCTNLLDEKFGYIADDTIELAVELNAVQELKIEIDQRLLEELRSPEAADHTDAVLLIDEVKLEVNKSLLAFYSPFFRAIFFSGFRESYLDAIPLLDVDIDQFKEMLQVLHPTYKPINSETIDFLLNLADHFQMFYVLQACEKVLCGCSEKTPYEKLVLADTFGLSFLLTRVLDNIQSKDALMKLVDELDIHRELSEHTMSALSQRILDY